MLWRCGAGMAERVSLEFILTAHEFKAGAATTVLERTRTAGGNSTQKGMVALHTSGSMSATSESFSALSRKSSIVVVKNSLSKSAFCHCYLQR